MSIPYFIYIYRQKKTSNKYLCTYNNSNMNSGDEDSSISFET